MRVSRLVRRSTAGLTLIEVLIATTLTLMLMLALAQGFKALSDSVTEGRTKLSLSDQLRGVSSLLRSDLERCTASRYVTPTYPGPGYFKYYDGPMWDSTGLYHNFSTAALLGSRWGDIDDVLMFTARANPGDTFRGTIPKALMIISQLNQFAKDQVDPNSSIPQAYLNEIASDVSSGAAWNKEVSIESDLAEIAWFMMPMAEGNRLPVPANSGPYISTSATSVVIDEAMVYGMPDNLALCRRVNLIRPDIDLNPTNPVSDYQSIITTLINQANAPEMVVDISTPASFRTAMHQFNQRCDLSLKPHRWENSTTGYRLYVKANTLSDLQLPENRFAHFTFPVSQSITNTVASATLPLLALTDESANSGGYRTSTDGIYSISNLVPAAVSNRGFILPCFLRSRIDGTPMLTEVVASNVIAFDAKVFDSTAVQLSHSGPDGVNGDSSLNVAGLPGTDDLAVSPSDPGYGALLVDAANNNTTPAVLTQGAFVDMGWSWRLFTNPGVVGINATHRYRLRNAFMGQAGGIDGITSAGVIVPSPSIVGSGSYYKLGNQGAILSVYQPNYDTYTDNYDRDGERLDRLPTGERFYRGGLRRFNYPVTQGDVEVAFDGVHNPHRFKESIPPANFDIPAVKVTIRVQDITAGVLQQMTVIQSFAQ